MCLVDSQIQKKLDNFFKGFKHQTYKKGEVLIRADESPQGIFYLTAGMVREYAISKKGDELVVNIFKPYAFFPMSFAINQTPNVYYYEAMEELEVWKAPTEEVLGFIKKNPDVAFDLLSRVYKGTDGLLMRLVYVMASEAYSKVIAELLISAKRFGHKNSNSSIEFKLSEKDLATQTGMARETVSREIKRLKDKGLITFTKSKLVIKDLQLLEDELNG